MRRKIASEPRFVLIPAIAVADSVRLRSRIERSNSITTNEYLADGGMEPILESKDSLTVPGRSVPGGHRDADPGASGTDDQPR